MSKVGLVLVSHSHTLAVGLAQLAGQMAPDVPIAAVGGYAGGLGTDVAQIAQALAGMASPRRAVVVLADMGSALLATECALDLVGAQTRARITVVDAPFVEGCVAAAVAAQGGADGDEVAAAARQCWQLGAAAGAGDAAGAADAAVGAVPVGVPAADEQGPHETATVSRDVIVPAPGLHARPVALVATAVRTFAAQVWLNGVKADSVVALMKLGLTGGQVVRVSARGRQAREALAAVVDLIASGAGLDQSG